MKTLFVTCKAKNPETAVLLKETLLNLKALSATEEGIVRYEIFQAADNELLYYVRETWSSEEALQKHLTQPHLAGFVELTKTVLQEPFTAIALETLA